MKNRDQDIENYAHELANTLPERSPEADRPRERFVVERVWSEGSRYKSLRVRVDEPDFINSHTRPGQYVTFQCGAVEPRFLVLANPPSATNSQKNNKKVNKKNNKKISKTGEVAHWEFLIDLDSDLGDEISEIEAGHRVLLSPAEGSGYPADRFDDGSVLIFTTGAGIASVRPVLQYWTANPQKAPASLAIYYGESDRDQFAYVAEFADWRSRGARIFQAIENLPEPEEGFRYVQHAFEHDAPDLEDTLVFVSGAPVMMELVIAKLMRMGVAKEHIFTNV